jgi:hypothetical protein
MRGRVPDCTKHFVINREEQSAFMNKRVIIHILIQLATENEIVKLDERGMNRSSMNQGFTVL